VVVVEEGGGGAAAAVGGRRRGREEERKNDDDNDDHDDDDDGATKVKEGKEVKGWRRRRACNEGYAVVAKLSLSRPPTPLGRPLDSHSRHQPVRIHSRLY
jgi:hypothetical protein